MPTRGRPRFPDQVTPAEWKVVEFVRHGLSNAEIARLHGFSINAVKYHVRNIRQKLGVTSRAQIRHWGGVARSSNLHARKDHDAMEMKLGSIGQVARQVADIEAARRWCGETLGLPHLYSFGKLAFFDCGAVRLFLSEGDGGDGASILYFLVPDIRAAHKALAARGINFTNAPHMIHKHEDGVEEWMAFFTDNEGRALAIMAQVAPTPTDTTDAGS
jgi:DNA-binding CsgD family transcriptional regulator/catechol 2,3-dioxygenase-like lactoylglutathione lyase family enzyme